MEVLSVVFVFHVGFVVVKQPLRETFWKITKKIKEKGKKSWKWKIIKTKNEVHARIEQATFCVLSRRDNHYTNEPVLSKVKNQFWVVFFWENTKIGENRYIWLILLHWCVNIRLFSSFSLASRCINFFLCFYFFLFYWVFISPGFDSNSDCKHHSVSTLREPVKWWRF